MPKLNIRYDPQGGDNQKLHPNQGKIFNHPARFKTLNCGRGFGKTVYIFAEIAEEAKIPNSIIWYLGLTENLGEEQMWDRLLEMFPSEYIRKINKSDFTLTLTNGTKILIKSAANKNTIKNLRGARINLLILDEAAQMDESVWCKVMQSAVRRTRGRAIFLSTPRGFNWFKKLCEKEDKDWQNFHFTTYDNPHYPKEEIDAQRDETKSLKDDLDFRQEVLAEFLEGVGLVYHHFSRDVHVTHQEVVADSWIIGIDPAASSKHSDDHGYTWTKRVGNKYIVVYEYKNNTDSLAVKIQALKRISADLGCYDGNNWINTTLVIDQAAKKTDPSNGSSVVLEYRKARVPVQLSDYHKQLSINAIKDLFQTGRLLIHPKCKAVLDGIKTWMYGKHEPDVLAALRYSLRYAEMRKSGEQIESGNIDVDLFTSLCYDSIEPTLKDKKSEITSIRFAEIE